MNLESKPSPFPVYRVKIVKKDQKWIGIVQPSIEGKESYCCQRPTMESATEACEAWIRGQSSLAKS